MIPSERTRADYKERASDLEARLAMALKNSDEEARQQAERQHNEEMEHLCEQHRLSMGKSPVTLDLFFVLTNSFSDYFFTWNTYDLLYKKHGRQVTSAYQY